MPILTCFKTALDIKALFPYICDFSEDSIYTVYFKWSCGWSLATLHITKLANFFIYVDNKLHIYKCLCSSYAYNNGFSC